MGARLTALSMHQRRRANPFRSAINSKIQRVSGRSPEWTATGAKQPSGLNSRWIEPCDIHRASCPVSLLAFRYKFVSILYLFFGVFMAVLSTSQADIQAQGPLGYSACIAKCRTAVSPVPMRQDRRQDKGTVVTLAFQEKPLQTLAACGLPPNGLICIQWRNSGLSGRISWDCQNIRRFTSR